MDSDGAQSIDKRVLSVIRTIRSLLEPELRLAFVRDYVVRTPVPLLANVLDATCSLAEQGDVAARESLVAIVDAFNDPSCEFVLSSLRTIAAEQGFLPLGRLVRSAVIKPRGDKFPTDPNRDHVPDYGRGRTLTLGERKSLARRPDREMMARLLHDPHPEVIRRLLGNPKVTEDDVMRLATKRPCRPDVLAVIARSTRWVHRARIRLALLLNPDMPPQLALPLVGLLLRSELAMVAESSHVAAAIRALCLDHLKRRPPTDFEAPKGPPH